tara:strand:- start:251 stop:667 length:417 start_codon:yes stop_codon:yes gene_type:complete
MSSNNDANMIILFDGVCNMCVWSVRFIILRDKNDKFRLVSIQSDIGKKIIKDHNIDIKKNDSIVLISNSVIKYRSSAVLSILYHLRTIWKVFLIFYIIPSPIRDLIYKFVAKTRYIFFGKRQQCVLPQEIKNSKFLNS